MITAPGPIHFMRSVCSSLTCASRQRQEKNFWRQKTKESEKKERKWLARIYDLSHQPFCSLWTGTQKMISRVSAAVERSWHTKQCKGSCQPVLCPHHPTFTLPTSHTCIPPPFYERNKIINCTCNLFVIDQLVLVMAISFLPPFAPPLQPPCLIGLIFMIIIGRKNMGSS